MRSILDPVVQSIVSWTSSLVVKMLSVLVSTICNSQEFLLKRCEWLLQMQSYSHFFSKNINLYAIFNDQSINDMLSNDMVSFEQLGPDNYNVFEPQREDSNQPAHSHSLIDLHCLHEETFHPCLSKMCPGKILIRLHEWIFQCYGSFFSRKT